MTEAEKALIAAAKRYVQLSFARDTRTTAQLREEHSPSGKPPSPNQVESRLALKDPDDALEAAEAAAPPPSDPIATSRLSLRPMSEYPTTGPVLEVLAFFAEGDSRHFYNAKWLIVHFAEGGGEEQPRFRGWFFWSGYGYSQVDAKQLRGWIPLPEVEGHVHGHPVWWLDGDERQKDALAICCKVARERGALAAGDGRLREALSNASAMLECRSDRAARLEWAAELRKKL